MVVGLEKGMEEGYPRCGAFASGLFEDCITPASSFPFRWLLHLGLGKKWVYFCLRGAARSQWWEPLKFWSRQVSPLNNWDWQIGGLRGKLEQLVKWPNFHPSRIISSLKIFFLKQIYTRGQELAGIIGDYASIWVFFYHCTGLGRLTWSQKRCISVLSFFMIVFNSNLKFLMGISGLVWCLMKESSQLFLHPQLSGHLPAQLLYSPGLTHEAFAERVCEWSVFTEGNST